VQNDDTWRLSLHSHSTSPVEDAGCRAENGSMYWQSVAFTNDGEI